MDIDEANRRGRVRRRDSRTTNVVATLKRYEPTWRMQWVTEKLNLIDRLPEGVKMDQYASQMLIVGCILKAMAAELWPAKSKERQRFVQLLIDYTPSMLGAKTISVPLLSGYLSGRGWIAEAEAMAARYAAANKRGRMLGIDVDMTEYELVSLYPNVPKATIRQFSYASLLFDEISLRAPSFTAERSWNADAPSTEISYLKKSENADWSIHFGTDWSRALVVCAEELSRPISPNKAFDDWWLR